MITNFPVNPNNVHFGSLIKFFYIPVEDIATEPEIFEGVLIGDYTFVSGKVLRTGYFDMDSAKLNLDDISDIKGQLIKSPFTAELSDNSPALDKLFCEMRCTKFVVFVIDNYKNVRVIGRKNSGAQFKFNFTTTSKIKNAPSYSFSFLYESNCIIPITTTQITDIC